MKNLLPLLSLIFVFGIFNVEAQKRNTTNKHRLSKSKTVAYGPIKDGYETHTELPDHEVPAEVPTIDMIDFDIAFTSTTLTAGQNYEAGTITAGITSDIKTHDHFFTIAMDMSGTNWVAGTTHIYVGSIDAIPLNNAGNPQIGQFPFGTSDINTAEIEAGLNNGTYDGNGLMVFNIPLSSINADTENGETCFTVLIHAEVYQIDAGGNGTPYSLNNSQTAWADGQALNANTGCNDGNGHKGGKTSKGRKGGGHGGGSWAMYNEYCQ